MPRHGVYSFRDSLNLRIITKDSRQPRISSVVNRGMRQNQKAIYVPWLDRLTFFWKDGGAWKIPSSLYPCNHRDWAMNPGFYLSLSLPDVSMSPSQPQPYLPASGKRSLERLSAKGALPGWAVLLSLISALGQRGRLCLRKGVSFHLGVVWKIPYNLPAGFGRAEQLPFCKREKWQQCFVPYS